jgi:Alpha/beta hydrolase of unknown function (DUF1400)/Acyl-coenzyme A:6-aminopenicillanic acid acyl-transferase
MLFSRMRSELRCLSRRARNAIFYLLLGLGISLLISTSSAHAAGTVLLQDDEVRLAVSLADLNAFVAGETPSPALQQFWQDSNQDPEQVKRWLTNEVTLPEAAPREASDFVLLQLNKTLGDPLGRERLDPLRVTVTRSLKDQNAFSVFELLQNYPESTVRLNVSSLEQVYTDVNLLVTRIEPILKVSETLLAEALCDCSAPPAAAQPTKPELSSSTSFKTALQTASTRQPTLVALEPSDSPTLANKSIVFQFGPLGRSISLADLTRFAETGELSRGWRFFLNVAGINPDDIRAALNRPVSADLQFLDRNLNNLLGEFLLYQVGQVVHTPSDTANIQAMRSAIIGSASTDGQLSLLEILQQYPTQQVQINGLRLARIGRNASRFQAQGGVRAAVVNLEDWLVELQVSATETLCTCDQSIAEASPLPPPPTISPEKMAEFLPANWQPVPAHREDRGIIKVVWQQGTPYEMGFQHGQYLHDEIASLGSDVIGALRFAGRGLALGPLSARRSYPEVVEECRGLSDATQDIGMTMDACLVLAYGDVYQEVFASTLPNVLFWDGCSQWVATGDATVDGRLYHGSTLDNDQRPIDYIVYNPIVFIRQPLDGLPHVFITYPGVVWPNWGFNVAGISVGLDTVHPGPGELSFMGRSNVQIMGQVLKTATSFAEAQQIMETQPRVHADLIMIADSKSKQAGAFELTGRNMGMRPLPENGVLYMTNHIESAEMFNRQRFPVSESSLTRFRRFAQLMEPDGASTLYGRLDPAGMAKIGRDRVNPDTMQPSPLDVFDDDASPGGNGSLRQGLYDTEKLLLWVAAGSPPVPENPFVCFSVGQLLNFPNAPACESPAL